MSALRPETRSPLSDGAWHRMHPLTPLLRGGLFLLVVAGIVLANLRERVLEVVIPIFVPEVPVGGGGADLIDIVFGRGLLLAVVVGIVVVLLVIVAGFYLSWRVHTFRISDDDVEVRSGLLFRTHRRAPLDRVQGVNLTRPMVARVFGAAKLEVVGAGLDANVRLEYLSTENAETVRADILRLASGRRLGDRGPVAPDNGDGMLAQLAESASAGVTGIISGVDMDAAEPESVVQVPAGRLLASRLLTGTTVTIVLLVVAVIVVATQHVFWALFSLVPAILGFGAYLVRTFVRSLRYAISPTTAGVRITSGLFTTVTEIIPPGRVHALEVRQPLLWRPFGWWTITINRLTGSQRQQGQDAFATVMPVGTRDDVARVVALLLPALPDDEKELIVTDGMVGPVPGSPFRTTPARARILRLLSWRRNGMHLSADALFLRRGLLTRALTVVPLARMQSVGIDQGPLARLFGVANLTAHVVPGSVTTSVGVIDRTDAVGVFDATARGVVLSAATDDSHRWAQ